MKKLPLFCTLYFVLCIGTTFGFTSEDFSNANYLADQGIITKQTTASKYRLDDKILRQEVIGMALKLKGVTLPENYTCKKYFTDATKNDWICRAVELAADNGIISRSNKYANPGKSITRAEAFAMLYNASGIRPFRELAGFRVLDKDATSWQKDLFQKIHNSEISMPGEKYITSDSPAIPVYFYPNRLATRTEVFRFTKNILEPTSDESESEKIYTNNRYNYSIKYPKNWYIGTQYSEDDFTSRGLNNTLMGGDTYFSNYQIGKYNMDVGFPNDYFIASLIVYKNANNMSLDEFIKEEGFSYDTKESITINGLNAILTTSIATNHPVGAYGRTTFIKSGENIYTFSYGDITGNKNNKIFILADKIINSFSL